MDPKDEEKEKPKTPHEIAVERTGGTTPPATFSEEPTGEAADDSESEEEEKGLEDMTHDELDALAEEREVAEYPKSGNKDAKIEAIRAAEQE